MKKKILALLTAAVLVVGVTAAGTMAWLKAEATPLQNIFTTSDVNIDLTETTGTSYQMIPGAPITKDPKVSVGADSVDCYLFVKLEKSDNYGDFLKDYTIATGWTQVDKEANKDVYYRTVKETDQTREFPILLGNQLTVLGTVTKDMMEAIKKDGTTAPTLTISAYAIQEDYLTDADGKPVADVAQIWDMAQPETKP